ncbi:MAG TPA: PAS domain S-box protein [Anditalea sp.]|nr:PAS domain S-box protein [Anditalea sp.]
MANQRNPVPKNEKERIEALLSYNVLDTISETEFDNITKLASFICQVPIALISFIDENRQWHKSTFGIEGSEVPRETSFCQYTIMGNSIYEVTDAMDHEIFKDFEAVKSGPEIRFYAGTPLTSPEGHNIGVLCVLDTEPKTLNEEQKLAMSTLAKHVINILDQRRQNTGLKDEFKKLAEKALLGISQELESYKFALDETSSVAITNEKGVIIYVNDKFCEISQYSREELLGQTHKIIDSNFHSVEYFENLWTTIQSGSVWKGEIKNQAKNGTYYWEESIIVPYVDEEGNPTKYISFKRDITSQKLEKNKIDQFFNLSLDYLCIANLKGFFEKISPTFSAALGYSEEELLSQPILNFVHQDDIYATQKEFKKLYQNITTISFENRYKCKDGTYKLLSWNASPNPYTGVIYATARDVTQSRKIDEENKRLSLVAKNTSNIIIITDKHSRIQWVNEPFENITQYKLEEIAGLKLFKFLNNEEASKETKAQIKYAIKNKIPFSGEILNKNKAGENYWIHIKITPVFDDNQEVINFIAIESDITEKIQRSQKIISLMKTQQSIFDGASYSIIYTDIKGTIKMINKACLSLLGYDEEEIIDIATPSLFHDRQEVITHNRQLSAKLGVTIPLDETFVYKARLENKADANEWTFITKSGQRIPVWLSITCINDKEGNVLGYLGVAEDYTLKKKVESDLINAKKIAEQAVKSKDNFLANMSHEIRTPMNAIIGFTDLLAMTPLNAEQKDFVGNVKMAGDNLLLLINDILDLSKIESGKLIIDAQPFNLKTTLKHVYDLLNVKAIEKGLDFNLFLDADMPDMIEGDKGRINQIVMNLAGNAIKFTKKGEVNILVKKVKETDKSITLKFSIKDTGIGISSEKLETIFERFSQGEDSTTRNFGGSGLGLNISKQLIELQNGELKVRSLVNVGSEFYFSLDYKKVDQNNINQKLEILQPETPNGRLSILLCEDNVINQRLAYNVIRNFGFEIDIADNGQEGLDKLKIKEYDLILMDLQMPIKDGYQTTIFIRENLKLDIPIIAMTAHSLVGERQKCYDIGMNAYVPKPFKQDELLAKILSVVKVRQPPVNSANTKGQEKVAVNEIDLTYLKELSGGCLDFEKEMIELFIPKVAEDLGILDQAYENREYIIIKDITHGLKSSLSLFLLNDLVDICSLLEKEADEINKSLRNEFTPDAHIAYKKLKTDLYEASTLLEKLNIELYSSITSS